MAVARSLEVIRDQINKMAPNRSKVNDGTYGDAKHKARISDHNENAAGFVTAIDITHDPKNGCDVGAIAEALRAAKDFRIKYMIWNLRICSATQSPWQWRKGDDHEHHLHISVKANKAIYNSEAAWPIIPGVPDKQAPTIPKKVPVLKLRSTGIDVKKLQKLLGIEADGKFGKLTDEAVKAFQKKSKLTVDGIVGFYTWKALDQIKI